MPEEAVELEEGVDEVDPQSQEAPEEQDTQEQPEEVDWYPSWMDTVGVQDVEQEEEQPATQQPEQPDTAPEEKINPSDTVLGENELNLINERVNEAISKLIGERLSTLENQTKAATDGYGELARSMIEREVKTTIQHAAENVIPHFKSDEHFAADEDVRTAADAIFKEKMEEAIFIARQYGDVSHLAQIKDPMWRDLVLANAMVVARYKRKKAAPMQVTGAKPVSSKDSATKQQTGWQGYFSKEELKEMKRMGVSPEETYKELEERGMLEDE